MTRRIAGASHQPYGASAHTSSMTMPEPMPAQMRVVNTDQSASRPASQVPPTMPMPKAAVNTGTAEGSDGVVIAPGADRGQAAEADRAGQQREDPP